MLVCVCEAGGREGWPHLRIAGILPILLLLVLATLSLNPQHFLFIFPPLSRFLESCILVFESCNRCLVYFMLSLFLYDLKSIENVFCACCARGMEMCERQMGMGGGD